MKTNNIERSGSTKECSKDSFLQQLEEAVNANPNLRIPVASIIAFCMGFAVWGIIHGIFGIGPCSRWLP